MFDNEESVSDEVQKREARGYTKHCPELGATGIQLNFTGTKKPALVT